MPVGMLLDKREIVRVDVQGAELAVAVGWDDVTRIEVYAEPGQMTYVPWIAVWCGDELWQRIPASICRIYYSFDEDGIAF